jgi:predicted DNA-binding transcriptional regulator YafY
VSALTKLEQVLPSRLRHRVAALAAATVAVPGTGPTVDASVLTAIASAIRAREMLRFDYVSHGGASSIRTVEPHRLVSWGRRWYLVGWDADRDDWRTFRVDRMLPRIPTGPRFVPRPEPDGDASAYVQRRDGAATWAYRASVRLHASAEHVAARLPLAISVRPERPDRCVIEVGSDTPHMLTLYLGLLDVDFEVIDAPELTEHLERMARRFRRAAAGADPGSTGQPGQAPAVRDADDPDRHAGGHAERYRGGPG